MRPIAWLLAGVVFLVGCGCTDVGCASGVFVSVDALLEWAGTDSFTAELCVGEYCDTHAIDPESAKALGANNSAEVTFGEFQNDLDVNDVTLTVTTFDDTMIVESSDIVFDVSRPNGRFCEPVCYWAEVTIQDGELVNQ